MHSKQVLDYFPISENFFCVAHVLAIYNRALFRNQVFNQLINCVINQGYALVLKVAYDCKIFQY